MRILFGTSLLRVNGPSRLLKARWLHHNGNFGNTIFVFPLARTISNKFIRGQVNVGFSAMSLSTSTSEVEKNVKEGIVKQAIREKLMNALSPVTHLSVLNESHRHNVPANSETHFKVVIVASKFETIPSLVERHRLVNTILAEELKGPVHALSIVAKTPNQWLQQNNTTVIEPSPACRGGDGSLPPKNSTK